MVATTIWSEPFFSKSASFCVSAAFVAARHPDPGRTRPFIGSPASRRAAAAGRTATAGKAAAARRPAAAGAARGPAAAGRALAGLEGHAQPAIAAGADPLAEDRRQDG